MLPLSPSTAGLPPCQHHSRTRADPGFRSGSTSTSRSLSLRRRRPLPGDQPLAGEIAWIESRTGSAEPENRPRPSRSRGPPTSAISPRSRLPPTEKPLRDPALRLPSGHHVATSQQRLRFHFGHESATSPPMRLLLPGAGATDEPRRPAPTGSVPGLVLVTIEQHLRALGV